MISIFIAQKVGGGGGGGGGVPEPLEACKKTTKINWQPLVTRYLDGGAPEGYDPFLGIMVFKQISRSRFK